MFHRTFENVPGGCKYQLWQTSSAFNALIQNLRDDPKLLEKCCEAFCHSEFEIWSEWPALEARWLSVEPNPLEASKVKDLFDLLLKAGTSTQCSWTDETGVNYIKEAISTGLAEIEIQRRSSIRVKRAYYGVKCVEGHGRRSVLLRATDSDLIALFGTGQHELDVVQITYAKCGRVMECKTLKRSPDPKWHKQLVVIRFVHDIHGWKHLRPCFCSMHPTPVLTAMLKSVISGKIPSVNLADYEIIGIGTPRRSLRAT